MKKVLIVRLDAIGDYVLWRNCLRFIRNSRKYRDAHLTVLGNPAWRSLAEAFDADCADEWIWVANRANLFRKSIENLLPYCVWHRRVRQEQGRLRKELMARKFDEVISPTAFPDPLLDELVQGIAPAVIGVANGSPSRLSAYTRLLDAGGEPFVFLKNRRIAEELTGESCVVPLELVLPETPTRNNSVLFFADASHWTRRWPDCRWRELETLLPPELAPRYAVKSRTLSEFANQVAASVAVVSNDTMALHMAAALNVPAVGVTNGCSGKNFFWPYPASLGKKIAVVSPKEHVGGILPGLAGRQISQYRAIASISAQDVFSVFQTIACQGNGKPRYVFDKGRGDMIPKKESASSLKGLVKWRGNPATLSQMDEAIAPEACK